MARSRDPGRLVAIADAALAVFTRRGFRNAQMADVAREAGVSPGTLYLYVEDKDTLFWLAYRRAGGDGFEGQNDLPIPRHPPEDTFREIAERAETKGDNRTLSEVASNSKPEVTIDEELRWVLDELYEDVEASKLRIKLVESSAKNWPELAQVWFGAARPAYFDFWAKYLDNRIQGGFLRHIVHPEIAARLITETVAWFGMHRYGDPDGYRFGRQAAKETVIDFLVRGLL